MLKMRTVYKDKKIKVEVSKRPPAWAITVRPAANLIPVTEDGKLVLQHEYRGGAVKWTWAFPGGMIEDGETAAQAAKRESAEEIGLLPRRTVKVCVVRTFFPETSVSYFLGIGLRNVPKKNWATERIGRLRELTLEELLAVARKGEIRDPRMEVAVYRLYAAVKAGRIKLR